MHMFFLVYISIVDGSKSVRLTVTLDVTLPSNVNFQVTKTFDAERKKLTEAVCCHLILIVRTAKLYITISK